MGDFHYINLGLVTRDPDYGEVECKPAQDLESLNLSRYSAEGCWAQKSVHASEWWAVGAQPVSRHQHNPRKPEFLITATLSGS